VSVLPGRPTRLGALSSVLTLAAVGCSSGASQSLDSYPPGPLTGVEVHERGARLADAIQEYLDQLGLPVHMGGLRGNVTETEWFGVENIEGGELPLAACPDRRRDPGREQYRARYRFSILPRAGYRLLRAEAHWQIALPPGPDGIPAWGDCRSTGRWERATEERIVMRARLMGE
jgi:hypothetical protein